MQRDSARSADRFSSKTLDYVHQGGQWEGTVACGMEQAEERPGAVSTGKRVGSWLATVTYNVIQSMTSKKVGRTHLGRKEVGPNVRMSDITEFVSFSTDKGTQKGKMLLAK